MPTVRVTRRAHFCSAHRIYRDDWSQEQNREVFGDCSNPNWHGHNYILDVTVEGSVDPETGYVVDLKVIKKVVKESCIFVALFAISMTSITETSILRCRGWKGL